MKNIKKGAILATKLSSFSIKPLTNWVARQERHRQMEMVRIREGVAEKSVEEMKQAFRVQTDKQIQTVGCLIRNYPYRFRSNWLQDGQRHHVGLGCEPIVQLKKKLTDLGLTPDDWPALVEHDELLEHLSKATILKLPLLEVLHTGNGFGRRIESYLGCDKEELPLKTVRDFLAINPLEVKGCDGAEFFRRRRRQLIAMRQKLVSKGCGPRDGAFFKWNPEKKSLEKALNLLGKYRLDDVFRRRVAEILVAERMVI